MKLVLCEADDLGALWVYESLRARDGSAVELVALLTSKWVEVQVGATRSYAIWAVTA